MPVRFERGRVSKRAAIYAEWVVGGLRDGCVASACFIGRLRGGNASSSMYPQRRHGERRAPCRRQADCGRGQAAPHAGYSRPGQASSERACWKPRDSLVQRVVGAARRKRSSLGMSWPWGSWPTAP